MKKIAVLGYGVVGSGVVELFYRNQKKIEKNTGTELEVGYILDLREFPDDPYGDRVVHDIQVILDDPEVGYVAECMGGVNPAFDFVRRCLEAGKSVATSNKQLVAEKGDILLQVAKVPAAHRRTEKPRENGSYPSAFSSNFRLRSRIPAQYWLTACSTSSEDIRRS